MPVVFKLKFGEETRRLALSELPSWATLSSRLTAIYDIPISKLGVSYTDSDGDEITLNTEEELLDFYETSSSTRPGEPLRLKVVDLSLLRGAVGSTPRVEPLTFDLEDEWQKFPSIHALSGVDLLGNPSNLDNPNAFVEVLDDTPPLQPRPLDAEDDRASIASTVDGPAVDKGKEREALSFPSTTSLIDEETGEKHPIHVVDRSFVDPFSAELDPSTKTGDSNDDATTTPTTPKPVPAHNTNSSDHVDDDPPLPTIDAANASSPPHLSSLTEDIAALLASLNNTLAANPQLGETFQRIMQNARSGAYWRDHRDSLRQTMQNVTQAMGTATDQLRRNAEAEAARHIAQADELRRNAEDQAARNISQLLGNLFQALSLPVPEQEANRAGLDQSAPSQGQEGTTQDHIEGSPRPIPGAFPHHPHGHHAHRWRGRGRHFRHSWNIPGMPPPPPPPPQPGMPHPPPPPPAGGGHPGFNPFGPPPPPPPHVFGWGPFMSSHAPPPPPPPPMGPPKASTSASSRDHDEPLPSDRIWDPDLRPSWLPPPPPPVDSEPSAGRPSPQELLASVTAAKEKYKEEKERYRREKQELRKIREERRASGSTPAAAALSISREPSREEHRDVEPPLSPSGLARSNTYLVSHARGPFPQLEMVSVSPRRSATISGGERERRMGSEDKDFQDARVFGRVSRRLADMGFTEGSHPALPAKIRAQLPTDTRTFTKAMEDEIVTNLLEDLLSREATPRSPVASGSGIQREHNQMGVPGGWQQ